ncbi:MAG: phage tail protein [Bryobacterales bacterium]
MGNLDGGVPFTDCAYTRADCQARGMFDQDSSSNATRRFGGIEFVPASILVRGAGQKQRSASSVAVNEARYNDFVPLLYGVNWSEPPVVFARNDGNLTRFEAVISTGEINRVVKVLVNNIEIPAAVNGRDMTASGWWSVFAGGNRTGGFNFNFTDAVGNPLGDPYGSMTAISIVVPNQINDAKSLPRVRLLTEGVKVERFEAAGASLGSAFSSNPAWILLDVLRRSGWRQDELDFTSFADAAAVCDEAIAATDNQGNAISIERFRCNLALQDRRTAADVVRGIRNNARLQLHYRDDGKLSVYVENSLLLQQPVKPEGSNAVNTLNGGWPAYSYVDGSAPGTASGILRRPDGSPALRMWSRPTADTPNRFSVEFADQFNEYQQDSLALLDADDLRRTGQEITGRLVADGLPTFDQAARILQFFLDKSIKGNRYIELETSVKGLGQRVGDIIAVTYEKEGLLDQPFRIQRIAPGENYRSVQITAQIHDDAWYNDTNGQLTLIPPTQRLADSSAQIPNSLAGDDLDSFGDSIFTVTEHQSAAGDGTILTELEVGFRAPASGASPVAGPPLVSLQANVQSSGGTLAGDQTLYYAVTALDANGLQGSPSFIVRAEIPPGGATFSVELNGLSFTSGSASFNVYRGELPSRLRRIAEVQALAGTFLDSGLAEDLDGSPDPQFDHANFYWRLEDIDEQFAAISGPDSVGHTSLALSSDALVGHAVRLIRGKGAGQERTVVNNDPTTLFVSPGWEIEPDISTIFTVSDNTWRFGGRARSSPARFAVPNLQDRVVQVTGRAANAQNVESLEGLALVSRWRIGGGGVGVADAAPPPEPLFAVNTLRDGTFELGGISFTTLENTQTITAGVWALYYVDEVSPDAGLILASAIGDTDSTITLNVAGPAVAGDLIQIDAEVLEVTNSLSGGLEYEVVRGSCDSTAAIHSAGASVLHLKRRTETVSFRRGFFGSPENATWAHNAVLPNARLACSTLELTNALGPSPIGKTSFTALVGGGLRSHHGGQLTFQIEGVFGVLDNATPVLSVQENLSIRDVYAVVKSAPLGADIDLAIRQDGELVATINIPAGATQSSPLSGVNLPYLAESATLTLDITAVGTTFPGADLTVTIRV